MPPCCRAALVLLAVCPAGCLALPELELLEGRLRRQEDALYAIRAELQAKEAELAVAQREVGVLRTERTAASQAALPAEHVVVVTRSTGIRFHSLLTRTLDRDGLPGDELLNVILTPHDADGESLKLPGSIRLELLDLSKAEGERSVAVWDFPPESAREHWHSGFIATGYRFELPWPEVSSSTELLLLGRMITHDGRQFDTTQTIPAPAGAPSRLVERPAATNPTEAADPPAGPALVPESVLTQTGASDEQSTLDWPVFELPAFDPSDQKSQGEDIDLTVPHSGSNDDPPPVPSKDEPSPLLLHAPPLLEPVSESGTAEARNGESGIGESGTGAISAGQARDLAGPALDSRHDAGAVVDSPLTRDLSVDGPPFEPARLPVAEKPARLLWPIPRVGRDDGKSADAPGQVAPVHRPGIPIPVSERPRSFYRANTATNSAPGTVLLAPLESGTLKPDSEPGVARAVAP